MVENKILNRKIIFMIVLLEIRYSFLKNLKLALGIKRVTCSSLNFLSSLKNKKQQKLLIQLQFVASPEKLEKYIANRNDSIGIALISNTGT